MTHYAAAGFPVGDDVASLVIGVIGAFVSLALLFMIKPRLRLRLLRDSPEQGLEELDPSTGWRSVAKTGPAERMTTSSKSAGYSIQIENLGLGSAVELEARLWLISTDADKLDTRTNIDLKVEKLLELSGKWHEARRTPDDIRLRAGNSQFRFELPRGDDFTVPLGQLTVPSRQIIVRSGQVDVGPQPFVISAPQPAVGPEQLVNDRLDRPGFFRGACLPDAINLPFFPAARSSFPRILSGECTCRRSAGARCYTSQPIRESRASHHRFRATALPSR